MAEWDSAAMAHLQQVATDLRAAGVIDIMAQEVRATWTANLERYEPRELGDTPQLLGLLCAGNIGQRVLRRYAGLSSGDGLSRPPVLASLPDGSLLVRACGVELQARKAPGERLQPDWSGFSWEESAGVRRHAAAVANSSAYRPSASDQDGRPPMLGDGGIWPLEAPSALRHVILVWAGDPEEKLTSGWLGFPCLGSPTWFAITRLWKDTRDERPDRDQPLADGLTNNAGTFTDRPEPTLDLGLRPRPRRKGQS